MATTPLHLIPPNYTGGPAQQSPQETSPSGALPNSGAQILLERNEIDKSLKSLENVLSLLYDYAQLWQNVVSLDKKLVSPTQGWTSVLILANMVLRRSKRLKKQAV